jgi:hypothetical protein
LIRGQHGGWSFPDAQGVVKVAAEDFGFSRIATLSLRIVAASVTVPNGVAIDNFVYETWDVADVQGRIGMWHTVRYVQDAPSFLYPQHSEHLEIQVGLSYVTPSDSIHVDFESGDYVHLINPHLRNDIWGRRGTLFGSEANRSFKSSILAVIYNQGGMAEEQIEVFVEAPQYAAIPQLTKESFIALGQYKLGDAIALHLEEAVPSLSMSLWQDGEYIGHVGRNVRTQDDLVSQFVLEAVS